MERERARDHTARVTGLQHTAPSRRPAAWQTNCKRSRWDNVLERTMRVGGRVRGLPSCAPCVTVSFLNGQGRSPWP
eukprot:6376972-Prymnesium_polylepis.1